VLLRLIGTLIRDAHRANCEEKSEAALAALRMIVGQLCRPRSRPGVGMKYSAP
jgi:hypothetical protein